MKPVEILAISVSCAYSNTKAHNAYIGFDDSSRIRYLSSDCERIHGKTGANAIEEIAPNVSCYRVKHILHQMLNLRTELGNSYFRSEKAERFKVELLSCTKLDSWSYQILREFIKTSGKDYNKIAERLTAKVKGPERSLKTECLENLFNRVLYNSVVDKEYPYVTNTFSPIKIEEMRPNEYLAHMEFAHVKRINGVWETSKHLVDSIKDRHFIPGNSYYKVGVDTSSKSYCVYCHKYFERMSKHTKGAEHQQRVEQVFQLAFSATSSVGLRMLNNPKYRHLFR